jgi:hypothetical protein
MADKSHALILAALERAVAEPSGLPLLGSKTTPGLFAAGSAARQAAQQCKEQGYLRVVRTEPKGKTTHEICSLTEKGLAYLLEQANPRDVLQAFVGALEARQSQVGDLLSTARATQANLDALKATAERVLQQLAQRKQASSPLLCDKTSSNGAEAWLVAVVRRLGQWQASGTLDDCPLPDLYRTAREATPSLTIGRFHDGLRRLHDTAQIYLHPWTGPLYEIPEPALALLVGHEIAYYVSLRS